MRVHDLHRHRSRAGDITGQNMVGHRLQRQLAARQHHVRRVGPPYCRRPGELVRRIGGGLHVEAAACGHVHLRGLVERRVVVEQEILEPLGRERDGVRALVRFKHDAALADQADAGGRERPPANRFSYKY